jgi:hypothetical protein
MCQEMMMIVLYQGMREFVTGNEIPRIVAHRCIIEASIGKCIVQTIEAPHSGMSCLHFLLPSLFLDAAAVAAARQQPR